MQQLSLISKFLFSTKCLCYFFIICMCATDTYICMFGIFKFIGVLSLDEWYILYSIFFVIQRVVALAFYQKQNNLDGFYNIFEVFRDYVLWTFLLKCLDSFVCLQKSLEINMGEMRQTSRMLKINYAPWQNFQKQFNQISL